MSAMNAYQKTMQDEQNNLVLDYMPALKALALRMKERLPSSVDLNDLISIGTEEMIKLSRRYDKAKNSSFWGFAKTRVQGAMIDYLRSIDVLSRAQRGLIKQLGELLDEHFIKEGVELSDEEAAKLLDTSEEKISKARIQLDLSFLLPLDEHMSFYYHEEDPYEKIEQDDLIEHINLVLAELKAKEALIIQLYYYEELSLDEIKELTGHSKVRICQLLKSTTKKIAAKLNEAALRVGDLNG